MNSESKISDGVLHSLSHSIRQQILEILDAQGPVSYKDLRSRVEELAEISTGSFYYHLRQLKDLIDQDDQKQYQINDLGLQALRILHQESLTSDPESLASNKQKKRRSGSIEGSFKAFKVFGVLINYSRPQKNAITLLLIMI
ncbi:MAG TPA: hypothetical protein VJ044_16400, partial [Candidatus Hodarchaeales archaeon]|nr:hypothetical protein [Candidatus Hodarchaeales archaeon]